MQKYDHAINQHYGLKEVSWIDTTAASIAWFQQRCVPQGGRTPPLGIHLLLGTDFGKIFSNQVHNAREQRIAVIRAVCERII